VRTRPRKSEHELISAFARIIARAGVNPRGLVHGVGDDTAVVRTEPAKDTLVTKDVMVEGRHFERSWFTGRELGWRLAAVNLSDIAAMGGDPRYALLSLVAPADLDQSYLLDVVRGIVSHLAEYGAALVGGNVSATEGPLVCDVTLAGVCARGKAWRRHARVGDAIVVAGELGAAAAGLALFSSRVPRRLGGALRRAYKRPEPRLDVSRLLRRDSSVHGAIDVSDGLSSDLIQVCRVSGLGCEVTGDALPVARATRSYCEARGHDIVDWAMRGGEDYALVLSVAPTRAEAICESITDKLNVAARVVGNFTLAKGVYRVTRADGSAGRFAPAGWDHFK
jgi:thiamine-monophosphate kinase